MKNNEVETTDNLTDNRTDQIANYAEWLERLNQAERYCEDTIEWNE